MYSLQAEINDEEEEKEVDPSLVDSVDSLKNVYTEAPGTMPGEDPFKRVPMMLDNEKPPNLMEMEKTLEAMEASIDRESSQESDSSDDMSNLDMGGMRRPRAKQMLLNDPLNRVAMRVDLERSNVGGSGEQLGHRSLHQQQRLSGEAEGEEVGAVGGGSIMPDLLTSGPTTPPDIQLSSQPAPDVTAHSINLLPPDIAASRGSSGQHRVGARERAVDLLHNTSTASSLPVSSRVSPASPTGGQPLDLTDGLLGLRVGDGGTEET